MTLDTKVHNKLPHLTRAEFLSGLAAILASLSIRTSGATAATASITNIAAGVHVHTGRHALFNPENGGDISNCGFIVGRDSIAIVDTGGSARVGAALLAAVRQVSGLPISHVINTHMHPDHVFGNAAFADTGAAIVAHHKMARGLAARSERYIAINKGLMGEEAFSGTRIVLPTMPIAERTAIDLGGRRVILEPQKTAHTDNDLTVLDEQTGTLFLGDLLFSGHVPTIDGSIRGWLAAIETLGAIKAQRVVPGHGPAAMAWPDALAPLSRYLNTVAADVRAAIRAGRTLGDAAATAGLSERGAWELFGDYHARNVSAAFAELEWE